MSSPLLTAIALPLALPLAFAVAFAPGRAMAQQAPDDRCTGTFCDFYYGGPPAEKPANAPPAAATPLTVPSVGGLGRLFGDSAKAPAPTGGTPAPAKRPLIGVGGGGILGMVRGDQAERCSGTFCDWYYGGPPPEKPAPPAAANAQPSNDLAPEQAADPDSAPPSDDAPRATEAVERRDVDHCAAKGADPWGCYR